jgi:hypothetical protein
MSILGRLNFQMSINFNDIKSRGACLIINPKGQKKKKKKKSQEVTCCEWFKRCPRNFNEGEGRVYIKLKLIDK